MAEVITDAPLSVKTKAVDMLECYLIDADVKRMDDDLKYCQGSIRYGFDISSSIKTTFLLFEDNRSAQDTVDKLNLMNHPSIMRSLGDVICFDQHLPNHVLPFPYFDTTYADYLDKKSNKTFEFKRFTPEFIQLTSQVVHGMSALQEKGFCCPNLEGKDIFKENNCISAKIWHFCICTGCTGDKHTDWRRLGQLLKKTAVDHKCLTIEIEDLCTKINKGILEGYALILSLFEC
ncbi:uncharacterized protein [Oryza sativa Japonica Group]|uniref:Os11g0518600 protein n=4 Tax=Oryza TaxID=4527 RepID=B9GAX6_ORYSJ|nr:uncharacterized protein LOC4350598 isoform X1 [Oryza sativa Japonica Group]XP_025876934.1 uncharacterized protein LOC4350598 isoform X1 [Oryza sativa Japonica Group]XP_025876935.1 uncharacterized protein LOC4350598 isoform X1 [Oryza sativa Japonica Group]EEC68254.1 hypothetical protein OsI_36276 [Oryza sativa Indica Group]KAB8115379.1 hypothetical protein EE612_055792 [Oryza sativa]EEE52182.1 hypothetical protein OsJ_34051 [Oryza sativa Japonica Group]KAF2911030.1 hypothetical protein DAI2|eukprot:NP_001067977.1 Os11g0518600 [Oryza sativa Japonica Group]